MRSPRSAQRLLACVVALWPGPLAACGQSGAAASPPPGVHAGVGRPPAASPPVAVGADTVQLLPRGVTAFPAIRSVIASARSAVEVEMYEFQRADIAAALIAARRRGERVTVIDDPTGAGTEATAIRLRAAGVDVVDYPVQRHMIDHVKLLVVDGSVAVVGGINWGAASTEHHDFDALIRGPAAANLARVFRADLVSCGRGGTIPPPLPDPAVIVASTLPGAAIRPLVLHSIETARRSLDLELFVLTDIGVVHALERAHSRGVAVHLLLDPSERPSDAAAAELRAAGVEVRLFRGPPGVKLHAKALVADSADVLFGSANWSSGGFVRNHEIDVELPSAPAIAAPMLAAMRADWMGSAPGTSPDSGPADAGAGAVNVAVVRLGAGRLDRRGRAPS